MSDKYPRVRPSPVNGSKPASRRPWRPFTVSVLAFWLPPGGAILTIRNLERLQELTPQAARRLLVLIVVICAVGLALLFLTAQPNKSGQIAIDSSSVSILSFGVAIASYLAQRAAFRTWQAAHPQERPGSVLEAFVLALVYYLVTLLLAAPLALILAQASGTTPAVKLP